MKLEAPNTASQRGSLPGHLASIPSTWRIARLRHAFNFNKGLTITKENLQDEGIPCVSYGEVHSKYGFEVDPDRHQLKCVDASYLKGNQASLLKRGDFIFADTSEDIEGSGNFTCYNSDRRAFAGYHTLIAKPKVTMNSRFMAYVFDSAAFRVQVQTEVKGVKVFSISQGVLKSTFVWFPPGAQQDAIAAFLDEKCAKVDEAVRIKEEQIALLRERRQILIQEAVTRGLNPDAPMKDSGIDWIGQVPAHWEVVPLRRVSRIHAGNGFPIELQGDDDGTIPFMKVSDFSSTAIRIASANNYVSEETIRNRKWNKVPKGCIVTAKIGEALRKNHRNVLDVDAIIDNNCVGFEPVAMSPSYFFWIHKVIDFEWFINPGAVPSISMSKYKSEKVPNPPVSEQVEVVRYIEADFEKIDKAVSIKEEQIAALKEYKTTLINAAVTGKIKVA